MDKLIDLIAFLAFFGRRALNFLNWRLIRAVGQLQLLTRASYIMLLVVPLLAGMWPAVRVYVNQHNKKATELTAKVDHAKAQFDETQKGLSPAVTNLIAIAALPSGQENAIRQELDTTVAKLKEAVDGFNSTVEAFKGDFAERSLKDPKLPWSFAAAFFAALFVVLGHLLYQLCAPDVIKAMTLDEFVTNRKDDYAKHPLGVFHRGFVAMVKKQLGLRAKGRKITGSPLECQLRGTQLPCSVICRGENGLLSSQNRYFWESFIMLNQIISSVVIQ